MKVVKSTNKYLLIVWEFTPKQCINLQYLYHNMQVICAGVLSNHLIYLYLYACVYKIVVKYAQIGGRLYCINLFFCSARDNVKLDSKQ